MQVHTTNQIRTTVFKMPEKHCESYKKKDKMQKERRKTKC